MSWKAVFGYEELECTRDAAVNEVKFPQARGLALGAVKRLSKSGCRIRIGKVIRREACGLGLQNESDHDRNGNEYYGFKRFNHTSRLWPGRVAMSFSPPHTVEMERVIPLLDLNGQTIMMRRENKDG